MIRLLIKLAFRAVRVPLVALLVVACVAPGGGRGRSSGQVKVIVNAPEFHIQRELYEYTPAGSRVGDVVAWVQNNLRHSERRGARIEARPVTVSVPVPELKLTAGVDFKMIQVHLGTHGVSLRNIVREGKWVFVTWLFDESDRLVEIVVTKVRPADFGPGGERLPPPAPQPAPAPGPPPAPDP